jgi:hypothetical protein
MEGDTMKSFVQKLRMSQRGKIGCVAHLAQCARSHYQAQRERRIKEWERELQKEVSPSEAGYVFSGEKVAKKIEERPTHN